MKPTTVEKIQQIQPLFDIGWKVAVITACGALAWASRDSEVAALKSQFGELKGDVSELRGDVNEMRGRYDDLVKQINADNTQIKSDLATLLERTKMH